MSAASSPSTAVEVRARVSGYLDKVHFEDGQIVKQGDLLFTIDKRPFQNTLDQARANLETAQSNLTFTEADVARGSQLLRDRTISEQVFEQRAQAFRNAQASVAANEAMVRQAELDLEFTELKAPISRPHRRPPRDAGQPGDRRHRRHRPRCSRPSSRSIRSDWSSPSTRPRCCATSGWRATATDVDRARRKTPVRLRLIDEEEFSHYGRMDFVDNVVDRATGTIRGRAQFANADGLFTPGMFARVQVPGSRRIRRCWCPMPPSAPSRRANTCWWSMATTSSRQRYVTLGEVVDGLRVIK